MIFILEEGKMKKKLLFASLILVLLTLSLSTACAKPAPAEEIVWKSVHAWYQGHPSAEPGFWFEELVNNSSKLKGKFRIELVGGPEAIGPFDQLEALQSGVVQCVTTEAAYWGGAVKVYNIRLGSPYTPEEARKYGEWDFVNEKAKDIGAYNMVYATGIPFLMAVNKPFTRLADLAGLKFRTSGSYDPIIKGVGGTPVQMPSSEIYTALERGVIDGYCNSVTSQSELGLVEVTKYIIDHFFWNGAVSIFTSIDSWNALPKDIQEELMKIAKEVEAKQAPFAAQVVQEQRKLHEQAGTKFVKFSAEDAEKWRQITDNAIWARGFKDCPEDSARLREIYGLPPWKG